MKPIIMAIVVAGCAAQATGYDPADPTKLTCPCDDAQTCYASAAEVDKRGENAQTGEQLLVLSQCACFQGSMAGCNTLGHFSKDWVAACERNEDPANSCTIAGLIYEHAVSVPQGSGRTFHRDPVAAKAAYEKACRAGATGACGKLK